MSELRQDLVSGDWIIVAPERFKRPEEILRHKPRRKTPPLKNCPFEDFNLRKSSIWPPFLSSPSESDWRFIVFPNKYPALRHFPGCSTPLRYGPSNSRTGAGEHDLVISRSHRKNFADLSKNDALGLLKIIQERYRTLSRDKCNVYSSMFCNWGEGAGASVYHPHYQILTLPIIPPDVFHSLNGSERYFKKHKKCVHCVLLKFDLKEKKRIIDQNQSAVSITPFVSRIPFEVRIFPKRHLPYFEKTPEKDLRAVAVLLQSALKRIKKYIKDPDFNFFIHTAPFTQPRFSNKSGAGFKGNYDFYHWHIEITPKISIWGGFELGTGIDINVVDPETAASVLAGKKLENRK